jgi:hypothetical protein
VVNAIRRVPDHHFTLELQLHAGWLNARILIDETSHASVSAWLATIWTYAALLESSQQNFLFELLLGGSRAS